MIKQEIIEKVQALNLPSDSYIVFGSGPLAAAGIRETNDIDMYVTPEVWRSLKAAGWQQIDKGPDDQPLAHDVFDVHDNWNFSFYTTTLEHLLDTADVIDGVPFASLDEVRKWKVASGRDKDLRDIELIDAYLAEQ